MGSLCPGEKTGRPGWCELWPSLTTNIKHQFLIKL